VRAEARKQKNWALGDLIRDRLKELGVMIEDGKDGTSWHWA
jgi:cysteinyl-tRNA synthetase